VAESGVCRQTTKRLLLFLWRTLPLPKKLRSILHYSINHKFILGVLALIEASDGSVLLFHHTYLWKNAWALPGGAVNRNDKDLRMGLRRELAEEAGLEVEVRDLIQVAHGITGCHVIDFLFKCEITRNDFEPSDEVDAIGFFPVDKLPAIVPSHRRILEAVQLGDSPSLLVNP
jgi:ADP-ribose pyrophosphatase YjhB (NUDIX family)